MRLRELEKIVRPLNCLFSFTGMRDFVGSENFLQGLYAIKHNLSCIFCQCLCQFIISSNFTIFLQVNIEIKNWISVSWDSPTYGVEYITLEGNMFSCLFFYFELISKLYPLCLVFVCATCKIVQVLTYCICGYWYCMTFEYNYSTCFWI